MPSKSIVRALEFDLYLPAFLNNGRRVPSHVFRAVRKALVEQFGGLTDFRYRNLGLWKFGPVIIRDEIVILRVMARQKLPARRYLARLKRQLLKELGQKEILIVERSVALV